LLYSLTRPRVPFENSPKGGCLCPLIISTSVFVNYTFVVNDVPLLGDQYSVHVRMDGNTAGPNSSRSQSSTAVNGGTTPHNVEVDTAAGGEAQMGYGCLGCRPAWLQFLTGARWFLLFACLSGFCQSCVVNGLIGATISSVERRFALSSSQSAWIASSYEIAGAPAVLIIGYFGSALHRPVWMGVGLVTLGVSYFIYTIPHFAAPLYRYSDSDDFSNLCNVWNTSTNYSLPVVEDR